jgi:predicted PurR-regulated permease PerM
VKTDWARLLFILVAAVIVASVMWSLRQIVILVGFSLLLAYALDPIVSAIERVPLTRKRKVPRGAASATVVLILGLLTAVGLAIGVPRLLLELEHFVQGAPRALDSLVLQVREWAEPRGLSVTLGPFLDKMESDGGDTLRGLGGTLAGRFGAILGSLGHSLEFALLPLLAFYLLAERNAVEASALRFVPENARDKVSVLSAAVDRALRSYVRGQAVVVLVMGTGVGIVLTLMGFHLAYLLGVLAGIGELIPYLGFSVAALAVVLSGFGQGPEHALTGLAGYAAVNWTVGTFVTPRVMGRHLKLHPFVVTVSVLAGAEVLGAAGAMLALPTAAVLQSLVAELTPPERATDHVPSL